MSKPMSLIIAWTYVCPSYVVSLDIRMSNLDKRMSNLTMLFNLTVSNFLTSGSFKNLTKHPESYIQSWIFGSFVLSKFQYQLGHTYVQAGHTFVQVGHTYVQVGHTYVQNNNASTVNLTQSSGPQTDKPRLTLSLPKGKFTTYDPLVNLPALSIWSSTNNFATLDQNQKKSRQHKRVQRQMF